MASDGDDADASNGAMESSDDEYVYSIPDAEVVEGEEEQQQSRRVARMKKASGTLRPVRRRAALLPAGGVGKRRREFLLWRKRCRDERRLAREKARLSNVRAPPDLLDPAVYLEFDLENNEIVVRLQS
jgi:hypothetical protein